ncbi:MAG: ABC transporter ATP-binding protein [Myxococcota bacterium]
MIVARDVSVRLGGRLVLDGFWCEAAAGEVVALLGPNGSGKSTALRAIAGLLPHGGAVSVAGTALGRPDPRRIACLFQEHPVAFDLTVREVVAMGGAGRGTDGLDPDRVVATLSGGERQRVHLARCLAGGAPVLLLDEPTNHLDLPARARIAALLASRTRTVVLASHDLELAALADRVVLLRDGRVRHAGPPADVLTADAVRDVFGADVRRVADPLGGAPFFRLLQPPESHP